MGWPERCAKEKLSLEWSEKSYTAHKANLQVVEDFSSYLVRNDSAFKFFQHVRAPVERL